MTTTTRGEVLPDLLPRITAAALAVRDAEDAYRLNIRHRDELIMAAVDGGISQREIAAAAGISKGRIVGIAANSQAEQGVVV